MINLNEILLSIPMTACIFILMAIFAFVGYGFGLLIWGPSPLKEVKYKNGK